MKKAISAIICALAAASLCACCAACGASANNESSQGSDVSTQASTPTETTEQPKGDVAAVPLSENENAKKGISSFTNELFKQCRKSDKGNNTLVSPLSVYMAFGMLNNGAVGATQTEITAALSGAGNSPLATEEINAAMKDYMVSSNDGGILDIANALFIMEKDNITINDAFKTTVSNDYFAEIFYEKYSSQTVNKINGWVSDKTHEMIPSILAPNAVNQDTVSVLVNAAAFEGKWLSPYDPEYDVEELDFTNYSGSTVKADFMISEENAYLTDENAVGFMKYYEPTKGSDNFCFIGILPNEGVDIDEYVASMTDSTISDMVENSVDEYLVVRLPKFSFSNKYSLPSALGAMGIQTAFEPGSADFTGICNSNSVCVGDVIHDTFIEVDESGTRAAAATAITMEDNAIAEIPMEPITITLDRPFVFAIYDLTDNIPVFIGTVTGHGF